MHTTTIVAGLALLAAPAALAHDNIGFNSKSHNQHRVKRAGPVLHLFGDETVAKWDSAGAVGTATRVAQTATATSSMNLLDSINAALGAPVGKATESPKSLGTRDIPRNPKLTRGNATEAAVREEVPKLTRHKATKPVVLVAASSQSSSASSSASAPSKSAIKAAGVPQPASSSSVSSSEAATSSVASSSTSSSAADAEATESFDLEAYRSSILAQINAGLGATGTAVRGTRVNKKRDGVPQLVRGKKPAKEFLGSYGNITVTSGNGTLQHGNATYAQAAVAHIVTNQTVVAAIVPPPAAPEAPEAAEDREPTRDEILAKINAGLGAKGSAVRGTRIGSRDIDLQAQFPELHDDSDNPFEQVEKWFKKVFTKVKRSAPPPALVRGSKPANVSSTIPSASTAVAATVNPKVAISASGAAAAPAILTPSTPQGWGAAFGNRYTTMAVNNHALKGSSTRSFTRDSWAAALASINSGDYVVLEYGHYESGVPGTGQDVAQGCSGTVPGTGEQTMTVAGCDGEKEVVKTYGSYLTQMCKDAIGKGAICMISSLTPKNEWRRDNNLTYTSSYIKAAQKTAETLGVPFINHQFSTAKKLIADGQATTATYYVAGDTLQTNGVGADTFAATFAAAVYCAGITALSSAFTALGQSTRGQYC